MNNLRDFFPSLYFFLFLWVERPNYMCGAFAVTKVAQNNVPGSDGQIVDRIVYMFSKSIMLL